MKDDDSKKPKKYRLGGEFGDKHLSRQEARCMVCLLKGATIKTVAKTLELSPRTVESYVNNIRSKLHCCSKDELVRVVMKSEFSYNVNLDPLVF